MEHIRELERRQEELEGTKLQFILGLFGLTILSILAEPHIQDNLQFLAFCSAYFPTVGGIGVLSREIEQVRWQIEDLTQGQVYGEF